MLNQHLDEADFYQVIERTPLISIDLIISDETGRYLLGLRENKPAINSWFVLGGRIKKGETISEAFQRVSYDELGLEVNITLAKLQGVYEHFYDDSFFDEKTATHYIVLAYALELSSEHLVLSSAQHSKYQWFSVFDILSTDNVHQYTKNYFFDGTL